MHFILSIKVSNAATLNANGTANLDELSRMLREIAEKLDEGIHRGVVSDINGNLVGNFTLSALGN